MSTPYGPPAYDLEVAAQEFESTQLWTDWAKRVKGERANDYVIVLTPHSATAGSGTGKTTLALQLCKALDQSDSGFDAETNATLDAGALTEEVLAESEPGSALLWDEAQGAPGTDGLDARRAMQGEVMDAVKGVLAARNQRHTLVIIGQQIRMFDPRLYPMIDAWLHIVKDPGQGTPTAVHYKLIGNDYKLDSREYTTWRVEELYWNALPADDRDYVELDRMKERAKTQSDDEEDEDDGPSITELADKIEAMDPSEKASYVTWHGGHHKWVWSTDRLYRSYDIYKREARALKDHLVEVKQLAPAEVAEEADREAPA